jgi:hypothetical protein
MAGSVVAELISGAIRWASLPTATHLSTTWFLHRNLIDFLHFSAVSPGPSTILTVKRLDVFSASIIRHTTATPPQ